MSQHPGQRPQQQPQQQQQQQQQRYHQQPQQPHSTPQNAGRSPYADPGSPIASVVQRNKKPNLTSPTTNTDSRVVYSTATPGQHRGQQQQHDNYNIQSPHGPTTTGQQQQQQPPRSPKIFSPRPGNAQTANPNPGNRYRHADLVQTEIQDCELPYLEEFGTLSLPPRTNGINYTPPCWVPIHKLLDAQLTKKTQIEPGSQQQAVQEYNRILQEIQEDLQSFYVIRSLPALPRGIRKSPIPPKRTDAPRISLVLDLDETLVHCTLNSNDSCAFTFPVDFNGASYTVSAQVRPHLEHFLRQVSQWFEVIIFTASQKSYADSLLNIIDPMNEFITHRLFRDSCVHVENNYIKDLSVLGRNLEHVIIVDNSVQAFGYHLNNGIPIESWFSEDTDSELLTLLSLLRHLKDVYDVRPYLRDYFRTQEFIDHLPE